MPGHVLPGICEVTGSMGFGCCGRCSPCGPSRRCWNAPALTFWQQSSQPVGASLLTHLGQVSGTLCQRRGWVLRVWDWGTGISASAWAMRICDQGTGVSASAWMLRVCDQVTRVPRRPALRPPEPRPPKYQDSGQGVLSSWKEPGK